MLKFILLTVIFIYVVYKVSNFVLKIFFPIQHARRMQAEFARKNGFGPKYRREQQHRYQSQARPSEGSIHVDYVPKKDQKKARTTEDFKGGDYVDYEEVK